MASPSTTLTFSAFLGALVLPLCVLTSATVEKSKMISGFAPLYPVATPDTWGKKQTSLGNDVFVGDIRAVVEAPGTDETITVQVWWRRRDVNPALKAVVVTTMDDKLVTATPTSVESDCGLVSFPRQPTQTTYYVYYLPHHQSGGGAGLHFHWYNCSGETKASGCVTLTSEQHASPSSSSSSSSCTAPLDPSMQLVTRLENRPNNAGSADHTTSGESFHGFTAMEFVATDDERSALVAKATTSPIVFMENRVNMVRMFAGPRALPAKWARTGGEVVSLSDNALVGEFYTFQVGLYNPSATSVGPITVDFSSLITIASHDDVIPSSEFNCFNTGGTDEHGVAFTKNYSVAGNGSVGSMWMGVNIPTTATPGPYTSTITLMVAGQAPRQLMLKLNVSLASDGAAVPDNGDADVYKLSRLHWLDSSIGIDDTVPKPFTNISVISSAVNDGTIKIQLLNKVITVGTNGLVQQVQVTSKKMRKGAMTPFQYNVFPDSASVDFIVMSATGHPLATQVTTPAHVISSTESEIMWSSILTSGSLTINITTTLDFTSYLEVVTEFSTTGVSVSVADIQLAINLNGNKNIAHNILGMGNEGQQFKSDVNWKWNNNSGQCDVWIGRVEAGIYLKLIGEGSRWENPQYSRDYPIIPMVPTSWGGTGGLSGMYGANLSSDVATPGLLVYSGPRTISGPASASTRFKFDLMFTPSKPLNQTKHWNERYLQIGYGGVGFQEPAKVAEQGVTVITLHQGIAGVFNNTMVNPYINWPFEPEVVNLLENYTQQAHALNLRVKFYYTIRELTNHAVELFALKALQGEIITDEDPYTIPQAGYCQSWDCHGGSVYLHEHVANDYVYCWQQGLSNGEWDASVCDMGVSRWFNYYASGAYWSVKNAPHIDGIYYDGINFDRRSFRRIRKLLDSASQDPLIDIHTGEVADSPSSVRYIGHFPFADSAWNGEGFKFSNDKYYWLVDASGLQHGISVDRLGGEGLDHRGMLFAQYERNSGTASALWSFWDKYKIQATEMIGWWENDRVVNITTGTSPTPNTTACNVSMTNSKITNGYLEATGGSSADIGFGPPGPGCGPGTKNTYPPMSAVEAIALCCQLGDGCAGFSIDNTMQGKTHGCLKKNTNGGRVKSQGFDGYAKATSPNGDCTEEQYAATTYVAYGSHAIIAIGSWCGNPKNINVNVDWSQLGVISPHVFAPAIAGVQAESGAIDLSKPLSVDNKGIILVVQSSASASSASSSSYATI